MEHIWRYFPEYSFYYCLEAVFFGGFSTAHTGPQHLCSCDIVSCNVKHFSLLFFPVGKESKCVPIPGDMQRRSDPLHVSSRESDGLLRA